MNAVIKRSRFNEVLILIVAVLVLGASAEVALGGTEPPKLPKPRPEDTPLCTLARARADLDVGGSCLALVSLMLQFPYIDITIIYPGADPGAARSHFQALRARCQMAREGRVRLFNGATAVRNLVSMPEGANIFMRPRSETWIRETNRGLAHIVSRTDYACKYFLVHDLDALYSSEMVAALGPSIVKGTGVINFGYIHHGLWKTKAGKLRKKPVSPRFKVDHVELLSTLISRECLLGAAPSFIVPHKPVKECRDDWACAEDVFLIVLARRCSRETVPSILVMTTDNFGLIAEDDESDSAAADATSVAVAIPRASHQLAAATAPRPTHTITVIRPSTQRSRIRGPLPLSSFTDNSPHAAEALEVFHSRLRTCVLVRGSTKYGILQACAMLGSLKIAFRNITATVIYPTAASHSEASDHFASIAARCPFARSRVSLLDVSQVPSAEEEDYGYLATNAALRALLRRKPACDLFMVTNLDNLYNPALPQALAESIILRRKELVGFGFTSHYIYPHRPHPNYAITPEWKVGRIDLGAAMVTRRCLLKAPRLFQPRDPTRHRCKEAWHCSDGVLYSDVALKCNAEILQRILLFHQ